MYYAVKVDVSGKQKYIFSTNRLKEIIGSSKIIEFVTEYLGDIILLEMGKKISDQTFSQDQHNPIHTIGGGNSIYIFENEEKALEFIQKFSLYVLDHFEGLPLIMAKEKFDLEKDWAGNLYERLDQKIVLKKNKMALRNEYLSFGMHVKCPNTGKAAGYKIQDGDSIKWVSKEVWDKRRFYDKFLKKDISVDFKGFVREEFLTNPYSDLMKQIEQKIKWMRHYYSQENIEKRVYDEYTFLKEEEKQRYIQMQGNGPQIPEMIQDISRTDDSNNSYIGLCNFDGNGMGQKISKAKSAFVDIFNDASPEEKKKINLLFLRFLESLSKRLKQKYETAFIRMREEAKMDQKLINPLIIAGDDISFITKGDVAIRAGEKFIRYFCGIEPIHQEYAVDLGKEIKKDLEGFLKEQSSELSQRVEVILDSFSKLSISGGISIVSDTYPIYVAQKLAHELEENAKKAGKENKKEENAIDWELMRGDMQSFSELRRDVLTQRPYVLSTQRDDFKKLEQACEKLLKEMADEKQSQRKQNQFLKSLSTNDSQAKIHAKKNLHREKHEEENFEIDRDALEIRDFYHKWGGKQ